MKDPAFLFYSNDFLTGTMLMTDEQIGQYIKLLCLQHQKGHLKEKDMLNICKQYDEDIFSKFKIDEEGNYYNKRLEEEALKRHKYTESRRRNLKKSDMDNDMNNDMETHMNSHMENEIVVVNENINNNIENVNENNGNVGESCVDGLQEVIDFYNNNIGLIPPYALEVLTDYAKEMGSDVVLYAIQISVEANKRTIQYIKGILNNWSKAGVKTLIEAKEQNQKKKQIEEKKSYRKYDQREYEDGYFDQFYANKGG